MGWQCKGCAGLRNRLGVTTCKNGKLCKRFDRSLVSLVPELSVADYEELDRRLYINYLRTWIWASSLFVPRTFADFESLLTTLHCRIFGGTRLQNIAGCYRDAPVYFGSENHTFEACNSNVIRERLQSTFNNCGFADFATKLVTKQDVVQTVAVFLEDFFAIHPFTDGNGRVARLLVSVLCNASGRWQLSHERESGNHRQRRKYTRALTHAHNALGRPASSRRLHPLSRDPYHLLTKWLDDNMEDVDNLLEEEPPE